ncbi:phosphatase PAP2 family protein [Flavobacterium restrictum]|uniref:Phosphatase PAP2 family protein n=1 Tax=Flavobacterium restrictum TaxID=2594428 RepID=A0A553E756_9FLAO|nr:phosphatase PAP2 family protein [Flavobacterium restrictum]TRX40878.1 phosphatase PAP2 family protein [Flavobacterium restrictum]
MCKTIYSILFFFCISILQAQNFDINTLRKININRNESLDPAFKLVTNTAVTISIATPVALYAVGLINNDSLVKKQAIFIGETFLVNAVITTILKDVVKRQRPYETYPEIQKEATGGGYSFPSGHTSTAFATATSLSMAVPKWYVIAPSFAWATAVGYSRMHLGVHYPTDVFAGALVGSGSAYLTYKINKWMAKKRTPKDFQSTKQ